MYKKLRLDHQIPVSLLNKSISILFLVCLSFFILLSVFLNVLSTIQTQILLIIIIVLGIIIFLFNKDKLEDIEKESEQEKAQEKKREMGFNKKYPLINKISGIRLVVRWMYKEGWWYSCGLLLLVLIGFGLRIWDLDFLSPMRDEYLHLVGAKRFMIEDTFNYSRAAFLTYIIGFLFKLNAGTSIFLARFPSVVFGTASIVAIYFLAKKINKKVGIISCFLITFSPFCVALSRFAREYQAYFLCILLLLLYLIYFFDTYDQKESRKLDKNALRILYGILILLTPAMYFYFIETTPMIIELYIIAGIFAGVFWIFKFIKSENKKKLVYNRTNYLIALIITIILILCVPVFFEKYDLLNFDEINIESQYGKMFFL